MGNRKKRKAEKKAEKKARKLRLQQSSLGISRFELILMIPGVHKKIYRLTKDAETIRIGAILRVAAEIVETLGRKANKCWNTVFTTQANALNQLAYALDKGGAEMKKIDLGITPKELMAALPLMVAQIWPHYNDDQKISADEGLIIGAIVLRALANPCDEDAIQDFFNSQAAALEGLAPLFEPEPKPEPAPEPAPPVTE